ncbi:EscU/YscU/HrcU family type III secretion system export apparatus switch protein [Shewanella sp. Isolate11]|uniref:EscU/YscU/HrcU family type III secretion system export apparatus switch protein n=1 Tax=Shewanella sp. Isolate11 TaxID=2908530 RepID=UPI001EFD99FF|nr:EscU/YscU/HrcU family type III secretion system export apparatus switch protein [Shewanella sp. Isolate11]MCG9697125.1 EscU/YscU/HrcU family type III secretion system export apparatus switch protein [Shewanella sp. Isolate11]
MYNPFDNKLADNLAHNLSDNSGDNSAREGDDDKPAEPRQAAALSYKGNSAPTLSAKGEALVAEEIIALAKEAGVHIHRDPNLSNFFQKLEVGEEIPKELYLLIAELIAFVYMLDGKFPERWDNMHQKIVEAV